MALNRAWYTALVDDDGTDTVGTVWGKDDIKNLLDSVDVEIARIDTSVSGLSNGGQVYATANQAVGSGFVIPNFAGVDFNGTPAYVLGASQFKIPSGAGGLYLVSYFVTFAARAGGYSGALLQHNAVNKYQMFVASSAAAGVGATLTMTGILRCSALDTLTLLVNNDVATTVMADSRFGIVKV